MAVTNNQDAEKLQEDLTKLEKWEQTWQMKFHPDKYQVLTITRKKEPIHFDYVLHGHKLEHVQTAKYLGVTISHDMRWNNSDKLEMVQRRAARFVKGRYGMYESVTQMLEELTWVPLSKRRENARLILFYKIINNLAMVPHSCLEKADGCTRKKHNLKFRHIGYNVDPYGQSFFPKCISAWNGLAQEIAEANTLDLFKSKLAH